MIAKTGPLCPMDWKARALKAEEQRDQLLTTLKLARIASELKDAEIDRLQCELAAAQKQFGVCSVCGFCAWVETDGKPDLEHCAYCDLRREVAEVLQPFAEASHCGGPKDSDENAMWESGGPSDWQAKITLGHCRRALALAEKCRT